MKELIRDLSGFGYRHVHSIKSLPLLQTFFEGFPKKIKTAMFKGGPTPELDFVLKEDGSLENQRHGINCLIFGRPHVRDPSEEEWLRLEDVLNDYAGRKEVHWTSVMHHIFDGPKRQFLFVFQHKKIDLI